MTPVLILPGIANSGPAHWQSLWESRYPNVSRVQQRDWDRPVRDEWVAALDRAVRAAESPPILVAHSLGCLTAAHWAAQSDLAISGALLVAPPDPNGPAFPSVVQGFAPLPAEVKGRRIQIVSSSNDPYCTELFALDCARRWHAAHLSIGAYGHINGASGLGDWSAGWMLVAQWRANKQGDIDR